MPEICTVGRENPGTGYVAYLPNEKLLRKYASSIVSLRWIRKADHKGFLPAEAARSMQSIHSRLCVSPFGKSYHCKSSGIRFPRNCHRLHLSVSLH